MAPKATGSGRFHALVVRPLVVAAALFGLYQLEKPAFNAAATGWHLLREPAHRQPDRLYESMRQQFAQQVPAGSRIVLAEMPSGNIWPTWIMEFASQQGVHVTGSRETADFLVTVRYDPGLPYDPYARLVIEQLR